MDNNLQKHSSVFWIEVEKVKPNPMQPRREFDAERLKDLSESIRQYGVLQPLVVTRKEIEGPAGILVEYELIAGERRLRASKLAGLQQVPVIIREDTEDKIKLELAIIENLQRENLNAIERACAFKKLIDAFNLKHHEVAEKIGKSRVFVTNTLRLLNLPEEIQQAGRDGLITEGHMRPILMLADRKEQQYKLFREIVDRKMMVRDAELAARRIAQERARNKENLPDPETLILEEKLSDVLGTRVQIEKIGDRGKIHIDFFSEEELRALLDKVMSEKSQQEPVAQEEKINYFDGGAKAVEDFSGETAGAVETIEAAEPFESGRPEDTDELARNFSV